MNLQLALILLGVLTFAGIVFFSLWQSRYEGRPLLERSLGWLQVVLERAPVEQLVSRLRPRNIARRVRQKEPSLVASAQFDLSGDAQRDQAPTASAGTSDPGASGIERGASAQSLQSEIGGQPLRIDYWARLPGTSLVSRDTALAVFREHEIDLQRPRTIHGRTEPGNVWLDLATASADEVFLDLIVSLQMADRDGSVTESELTRFNNLAYYMSESLNRHVKLQ